MTAKEPAQELRDHIARTYRSVRIGTAVIGAALPLLLWVGGYLGDAESLRASMSAYYYSPVMGDWFVGGLVATGALLYLYKGFSTAEDWLLNAAGVLVIGVALVPTVPASASQDAGFSWHGTLAVAFFICIACVCIFRASDTLSLIRDTAVARRFRVVYRLLGAGMVASPLIAVVFTLVFRSTTNESPLVFFVEAVAVWIFATYWLTKSWELRRTRAEQLALERKLRPASIATAAAPGRIVQIEPDVIPLRDWESVLAQEQAAAGPRTST